MNQLTLTTQLQLREADADSGLAGQLEGLAVPYGTEIELGGLRESFGPGSFDPDQVIGQPLCWRHDEPIGVITAASNSDAGLTISADIADTALGRDAARLVRMGSVKGLSVGFQPIQDSWNRAKTSVTRVKAQLRELSLTHVPAYATAGVSVIREETTMPEQADTTAAPEQAAVEQRSGVAYATQDELAQLRERIATMSVPTAPQRELGADEYLRQLGTTLVTRAWPAGGLSLDGTDSDISAPPASVSAVVEFGRPTVTAIGVQPLGATGMDAYWMTDKVPPQVAEQSAEFAVIATAEPEGQLVSAPVKTYAGGNRNSIQFLLRADVWDYPHLLRLYAEQYARRTNAVVAATVQGAAANTIQLPTTGLTLESLAEKLGKGAAKIAAGTGRAPQVCVLDAEKFFTIGTLVGAGFPLAGGTSVGNANLASLSFSALGLRWVCDPSLVNGGFMLDTWSIGIKESAGAPFQIDAAVVQELARDTALYGFMAHTVLNADGIVSFHTGTTK